MCDAEHSRKFTAEVRLHAGAPSIIVRRKLTLHISLFLSHSSLISWIFMAISIWRKRPWTDGSAVFLFLTTDGWNWSINIHHHRRRRRSQRCNEATSHLSPPDWKITGEARSCVLIHIDRRPMTPANLAAAGRGEWGRGWGGFLTSSSPPLIRLIFVQANTSILLRQLCGSRHINTVITLITLNSKFAPTRARTQLVSRREAEKWFDCMEDFLCFESEW